MKNKRWKIGTFLKDFGERRGLSWLKGLGYRIRGHVA